MKTRMLSFILVIVLMLSASALLSCNDASDNQEPDVPPAEGQPQIPDGEDTTPPSEDEPTYELPKPPRHLGCTAPKADVTPDGQACESVLVWATLDADKAFPSNVAPVRMEISWTPEQLLAVAAFGIFLPYEEVDGKRVFYLDTDEVQGRAMLAPYFKVQLYLPEGFFTIADDNNGEISITCYYDEMDVTFTTQLRYGDPGKYMVLADDARMAWLPIFGVLPTRTVFTGEVLCSPDINCLEANYRTADLYCRSLEGMTEKEIERLKPYPFSDCNITRYRYEGTDYYIVEFWESHADPADDPMYMFEWEHDGKWYSFVFGLGYDEITSVKQVKEIIHGIQYP